MITLAAPPVTGTIQEQKRKRAFCWDGHGNTGILAVGYMQRIYELGIKADLHIGTAVGAINAAIYHSNGKEGHQALKEFWLTVSNKRVYRWTLNKRGPVSLAPLKALLSEYVAASWLTSGKLAPLYIGNLDLMRDHHTYRPIASKAGDPLDQLLSTVAIPGLVAPIQGFLSNVIEANAVRLAIDLGSTDIYCLRTLSPRPQPLNSVADVPELALGWLNKRQHDTDGLYLLNTSFDERPRYKYIEPMSPSLPFKLFDFDYNGHDRTAFFEIGYKIARRVLG